MLYVQDRTDALPHVLIDPYSFSKDGLIPVVDQSPSADGRYIAYAVTSAGRRRGPCAFATFARRRTSATS